MTDFVRSIVLVSVFHNQVAHDSSSVREAAGICSRIGRRSGGKTCCRSIMSGSAFCTRRALKIGPLTAFLVSGMSVECWGVIRWELYQGLTVMVSAFGRIPSIAGFVLKLQGVKALLAIGGHGVFLHS